MDPIDRRLMLGAAGLAGVAALSKFASPVRAGPLDPPAGPITSTGHTLDQIYARVAHTDAGIAEPRVPIQSLPGSATARYIVTEPGSYYLTGNIEGEAGKHAIEVNAPNVAIDLMGYRVAGVGPNTRGVSCVLNQHTLLVHNGTMTDCLGGGVVAPGRESTVFNMCFERCGGGVVVGAGSRISDCTFRDNVGPLDPVIGGDWMIVERCLLLGGWGNEGIAAYRYSIIKDCVIDGGFSSGILAEYGCLVTGCDVRANFGGITARQRCRVIGNLCRDMLTGIFTQWYGSEIRDNACLGVANGVHASDSNGASISGNTVDANDVGILVDGTSSNCVLVGNKVRASATTRYSVIPGNAHGPIVNVAGVGDITGVPNANHPWANFVY